MSDQPVVRAALEGDKAAVVEVLSRAFARDPLFLSLFGGAPDSEPTHLRRRRLIGYLYDMNRAMGGTPLALFVGDAVVGGALTEPPGTSAWRTSLRLTRAALGFFPLIFRQPLRVSLALNDYMRISRSAAPASPHHYLVMVGVSPELHGRGYGRMLIAEVLRQSDADPVSRGVALDTENAGNIALYERYGFRVGEPRVLGEVTVHAMYRAKAEARASAQVVG